MSLSSFAETVVAGNMVPGQDPFLSSHGQFQLSAAILSPVDCDEKSVVVLPSTSSTLTSEVTIPVITQAEVGIVSLRSGLFDAASPLQSNPLNILFSALPCSNHSNSCEINYCGFAE